MAWHFRRPHYVTLLVLASAVALQVSTLKAWPDVTQPAFVGGLACTVFGVVKAMFDQKPERKDRGGG